MRFRLPPLSRARLGALPTCSALLTFGALVACSVYSEDLLLEHSSPDGDSTMNSSGTDSTGSIASITATSQSTFTTSSSTTAGVGGSASDAGGAGNGGTATVASGAGDAGGAGGAGESSATETTATSTTADVTTTTASTAGTGGSGATTTGAATSGTARDPLLIDDLEDGNGQLVNPLNGYWYVAWDTEAGALTITAPATPDTPKAASTSPARENSDFAMHAAGSWDECVDPCWGAAFGFSFKEPASAFDITDYTGVSFYARTGSARTVRFEVATEATAANSGHYGVDIDLTTTWTQYEITWAELEPPIWASTAEWEPTTALKVQFHFGITDFDLWVDDVYFTE